jgi:4-carboxymuconolactone decarboxylase
VAEKSAAYRRGVAARQAIFGEEGDERLRRWDKLDPTFADYMMESVWGGILSRPGLERRDRELITIAALTVLGKEQELDHHIKGGLTAGLSKQEVLEAIIQMGIYAGMPACLNGLRVAEQVFRERGLLDSDA